LGTLRSATERLRQGMKKSFAVGAGNDKNERQKECFPAEFSVSNFDFCAKTILLSEEIG
jgi:hypothetical protein